MTKIYFNARMRKITPTEKKAGISNSGPSITIDGAKVSSDDTTLTVEDFEEKNKGVTFKINTNGWSWSKSPYQLTWTTNQETTSCSINGESMTLTFDASKTDAEGTLTLFLDKKIQGESGRVTTTSYTWDPQMRCKPGMKGDVDPDQ